VSCGRREDDRSRPAAPPTPPTEPRRPGRLKGAIVLAPDFDELPPEFDDYTR
jgi:hypothetical protein